MKTTKQWLQTLPKGLRESAMENIISDYYEHDSLSKAILCIQWFEDDYDFWHGFYYNLKWAEGE